MDTNNDNHFPHIVKFLAWTSGTVLIYVFAITFIPIPPNNLRFVDTCIGFLLGTVLSGAMGYIAGGTPPKKSAETKIDAEVKIDQPEGGAPSGN